MAAAPGHPVYVQLFYQWAMLTPEALQALKIGSDIDLPAREQSSSATLAAPSPAGSPVRVREFGALFAKLPAPGEYADQVAGTRQIFPRSKIASQSPASSIPAASA